MEQKKAKELAVLIDVLAETQRFEKRLKELISDLKAYKDYKYHYTKYRAGVKRSGIDLKKEISRITTASGCNGDYFYS